MYCIIVHALNITENMRRRNPYQEEKRRSTASLKAMIQYKGIYTWMKPYDM